jgi:hypothetical protein
MSSLCFSTGLHGGKTLPPGAPGGAQSRVMIPWAGYGTSAGLRHQERTAKGRSFYLDEEG